jgi:hypothetical protein
MDKLLGFFSSELGRRLIAIGSVILSALAQSGHLPLDYAIPHLGLTTGQILGYLGIGVAATSGSNSRK